MSKRVNSLSTQGRLGGRGGAEKRVGMAAERPQQPTVAPQRTVILAQWYSAELLQNPP